MCGMWLKQSDVHYICDIWRELGASRYTGTKTSQHKMNKHLQHMHRIRIQNCSKTMLGLWSQESVVEFNENAGCCTFSPIEENRRKNSIQSRSIYVFEFIGRITMKWESCAHTWRVPTLIWMCAFHFVRPSPCAHGKHFMRMKKENLHNKQNQTIAYPNYDKGT